MAFNFFTDPLDPPRPREDVRLRSITLNIYSDLRRVAFGAELSPFMERPSIDIVITNARGETVSSLIVIESMAPTFRLTMHLRDPEPTNPYRLVAVLYYTWPEKTEKLEVERREISFDVIEPGEKVFLFEKPPRPNPEPDQGED